MGLFFLLMYLISLNCLTVKITGSLCIYKFYFIFFWAQFQEISIKIKLFRMITQIRQIKQEFWKTSIKYNIDESPKFLLVE